MTLKVKLTSTIAAFVLVLGLLIMGVFASPTATINLGGSISFKATDVHATVQGKIAGSKEADAVEGEINLNTLNFKAGATEEEKTALANGISSWENNDITFKDDGAPVTITVTITNLATDRPLYATITDTAVAVENVTRNMAIGENAYTGDVITVPKAEVGKTDNVVVVTLTIDVTDPNVSLVDESVYGYQIDLNNENPDAPKTVEWHKVNSLIDFNLTTDGDTRTAAVKMVDVSTTKGDIVVPSYVKDNEGNVYTVTSVADYGFGTTIGDTAPITSIKLPNTITTIGEIAFTRCFQLTGQFVIPNSVKVVGQCAFYMCRQLTSIIMGDSVERIGYYAFQECTGLTEIVIPESVTTIGEGVFLDCTGLTGITIPNSVEVIEDSAFGGCKLLSNVYYTGSEEEWGNITIDSSNNYLISATKHYNYVVSQ